MSSGNTPSLLGEETTLSNTFKRSFDQIDVDVEELDDVREPTPSSSSGSGRTPESHKRARSETRSDDEPGVARSSGMNLPRQDEFSSVSLHLSPTPGPSTIHDGDIIEPNQSSNPFNRYDLPSSDGQPATDQTPDADIQFHLAETEQTQQGQDRHEGRIDLVILRSPSPRSISATTSTQSREVFVISDSEDEVQILPPPAHRPSEVTTNPFTNLPDVENPWVDPVVNDNHPTSSHRPQRTLFSRYGINSESAASTTDNAMASLPPLSELMQVRPRTRLPEPWSIDDNVFHARFFDGSWDPRVVDRTGQRSPFGARRSSSSSPEPGSPLALTASERDELRQRRLEARRRAVCAIRRASSLAEDNLIPAPRDGLPPTSSVTPASMVNSVPTLEGRGQRSIARQPPPEAHVSRDERLRRALRAAQLQMFRPTGASPAPQTSRTPSEQRRHSLVMEGVLSDNPELYQRTRQVCHRATPPTNNGGTQAVSADRGPQASSAQMQAVVPPPSYPLSRLYDLGTPIRSNTPLSRGTPLPTSVTRPAETTATSTLTSQGSRAALRVSVEPAGANASSSPPSIHTAPSSRLLNVPVVASPLRQTFQVDVRRGAFHNPVPAGNERSNEVELRDIASRLQSLTTSLASLVARSNTSAAVRDAAIRVINSGHALSRAVDADNSSPSGPGSRDFMGVDTDMPTAHAPPQRSVVDHDQALGSNESSTGGSLTTRLRELTEETARLRELSEETARLRELSARRFDQMDGRRTRSPSFVPSLASVSSASSQRTPPLPPPFTTWHTTSSMFQGLDVPLHHETSRRPEAFRPNNIITEADNWPIARGEELRINSEGRIGSDRWTQARQRRRELEDALLAEEVRLLRTAYDPPSQGVSDTRDTETDSTRMDVDSEEEVEFLFDAGALGSLDSSSNEASQVDQHDQSQTSATRNIAESVSARDSTVPAVRSPHQRTDAQSRLDSRLAPPAPHDVIDLEAYHHGPFRAALARAVESSRRQQLTGEPATNPSGMSANASSGASHTRDTNLSRVANQSSEPPTVPLQTRMSSTTPARANRHAYARPPALSQSRPRPHNEVLMGGLLHEWEAELQDLESLDFSLDSTTHPAPRRSSQSRSAGPNNAASSQLSINHTATNISRGNGRTAHASDNPTPPVPPSERQLARRRPNVSLLDRLYEPRASSQSLTPPDSPYRTAWRNGLHEFDDRILFESFGRRDPRGVPDSVTSSLPTGTYGEWAVAGETEDHCPICFDEYSPSDPVMKLPKCKHWFHKPCIEQWFKTASTCPICRERVSGRGSSNPAFMGYRRRPPANASGVRNGPFGHPFTVVPYQSLPLDAPTATSTARSGADPRRRHPASRGPLPPLPSALEPFNSWNHQALWNAGFDVPDPLSPTRWAQPTPGPVSNNTTTTSSTEPRSHANRTQEEQGNRSRNSNSQQRRTDALDNLIWDLDDEDEDDSWM